MAKFEVRLTKKCVQELVVTVEALTRDEAVEEAINFASDPLVIRKRWTIRQESNHPEVSSVKLK